MTLADWIKLLSLVASIAGSAVAILRTIRTQRQVTKHAQLHAREAEAKARQLGQLGRSSGRDSSA